jgi:hypothetical protein
MLVTTGAIEVSLRRRAEHFPDAGGERRKTLAESSRRSRLRPPQRSSLSRQPCVKKEDGGERYILLPQEKRQKKRFRSATSPSMCSFQLRRLHARTSTETWLQHSLPVRTSCKLRSNLSPPQWRRRLRPSHLSPSPLEFSLPPRLEEVRLEVVVMAFAPAGQRPRWPRLHRLRGGGHLTLSRLPPVTVDIATDLS